MAVKIYTKTGDLGKTSLIGGTKVLKSNIRIDTYGTVDELNAYMGLLSDHFSELHTRIAIKEIQDRLFTIGSALAVDPEKEPSMKIPDLKETDIYFLEKEIDQMQLQLPEMKNFIIPGGHPAVSTAHVARCICRRTERCCVHMMELDQFVDPLIIKYLNRLSDYLFVLARFIGNQLKIEEQIWKPRI